MEKINEGTRDEIIRYNFFSDELFGIEGPIAKIVEYFKSAGATARSSQANSAADGTGGRR